ncbi:SdpI family protein [Mycobacterium paraterrae]|uniref:SdpI family protein n=1 Tax=Mycobacterium paraterrae TaxID=577492 RepID=A0ABY3VFK4_9MYCO|nr:SdpI family protein [Mycobacterium paraterrae]UMB68200.2 SdpI family protein [Mycobacterium paraterrae]
MIVSGRCMPVLYPDRAVLQPPPQFAQYGGAMEPRQVVATFMAVTFALLAFLIVAVDWAAANGRLKRNQWVGIRLPSTMRSDRAWLAGHQAALRLMPLHLLTGVGLLLAVLSAPTIEAVNVIGIVGAAVFVVVALITGIAAGRAAKAVEE